MLPCQIIETMWIQNSQSILLFVCHFTEKYFCIKNTCSQLMPLCIITNILKYRLDDLCHYVKSKNNLIFQLESLICQITNTLLYRLVSIFHYLRYREYHYIYRLVILCQMTKILLYYKRNYLCIQLIRSLLLCQTTENFIVCRLETSSHKQRKILFNAEVLVCYCHIVRLRNLKYSFALTLHFCITMSYCRKIQLIRKSKSMLFCHNRIKYIYLRTSKLCHCQKFSLHIDQNSF